MRAMRCAQVDVGESMRVNQFNEAMCASETMLEVLTKQSWSDAIVSMRARRCDRSNASTAKLRAAMRVRRDAREEM